MERFSFTCGSKGHMAHKHYASCRDAVMAAIRWNAKHPKAGLARIMRCEVSDHVLEMVENAAIWPMIPTAEYSGPVWQEVDNA